MIPVSSSAAKHHRLLDGLVRVDFNGDASGEIGWDMAIQVNDFTGTFTNANFDWIV